MKLTKSRVESLPIPTDVPTFHWDQELRGFGVKVLPSGKKSYIAQGRVHGKAKRETLGTHGVLTCDKARDKAKAALLRMSDGIDFQLEKKRAKSHSITLREVVNVYCSERRTAKGGPLTPKTQHDIQRHIKTSFADWADYPIANITRDLCSDRFSELTERGPAQANQAFRILRALINFAMEAYRPGGVPIMLENPFKVISGKKMWNPNVAKSSRIPMEKIGAVWNLLQEKRTSPEVLPIGQTGADIITFIMLTGCRWSEAAQLTWDRVNLEGGFWKISDPKNHYPVTLLLSAQACQMLSERPRIEGNDCVFPARGKDGYIQDARHTMAQVSEAAGEHLTPHDLRRTFRAIAGKCGIEQWKTKLLMNHISTDVTITNYTETNDMSYLSGEAEQIATWIVHQGAIAAAGNVVQLRGAA